jgi:hypothetical protein
VGPQTGQPHRRRIRPVISAPSVQCIEGDAGLDHRWCSDQDGGGGGQQPAQISRARVNMLAPSAGGDVPPPLLRCSANRGSPGRDGGAEHWPVPISDPAGEGPLIWIVAVPDRRPSRTACTSMSAVAPTNLRRGHDYLPLGRRDRVGRPHGSRGVSTLITHHEDPGSIRH